MSIVSQSEVVVVGIESVEDYVAHLNLPTRWANRWAWKKTERAFGALVAEQDERIANGQPVRAIPLHWIALAEMVGLTVDDTGRIIDGPKAEVLGL
jgi:hypothetical protein